MTAEEIAIRTPVWSAMSDLFLDTDVRIWYPWSARAIALSPYSFEELDLIFSDEVRPVLSVNMLMVAGEWAGFDTDWLVSKIVARGKPRHRSWLPQWKAAQRDWESVVLLTKCLRKLDSADLERRIQVWFQLSKLFLHRNWPVPVFDPPLSKEQLDAIWSDEVWPAYNHAIDEYHKESAEFNPSVEEVQQSWIRIRNALS